MIPDDRDAVNVGLILARQSVPPAFEHSPSAPSETLARRIAEAVGAWLAKTPSQHTRRSYASDVGQFLHYCGIDVDQFDRLATLRPGHVSAWRDELQRHGLSNATVRRKLTAIRSLFSYLQIYGYTGANPAHGKFVAAPAASRHGKTVGLSPRACRQLLEAPSADTPAGIRDRAILGVLAYSACRAGELVRLTVGDFKTSGEHRVLCIHGKGGKERIVPLHLEAVERLSA